MAAGALGPEAIVRRRRVRGEASILESLSTVAPPLMVGVLGAQGLLLVEDHLRIVAVGLLLFQSLPLLARARFPLLVLGVTAIAAAVQLLLGMPATNASLGQAVATVSVVSKVGRPVSLVPPAVVLMLNSAAAWMGGLPDLGREVFLTGVSLTVAWMIGDAAGRRAAVAAAVKRELAVRTATVQWKTQLTASAERLRIAQELHRLVGEALDAIVVHSGAARLRPFDVREHLVVIESIARDVLTELDRFLGVLRRSAADVSASTSSRPVPPVAVSPGYGPSGSLAWVVDVLVELGPAVVLLALAMAENLAVPPGQRPADLWVVALTSAATLPLVIRRRWPRFAAAVVCSASAIQLLIGMPVGNGVLAVVVAAHAVAVQCGWKRAAAWGLGSTGVLVALDARLDPLDALELGLVVGVMVIGAIYIGDTARVAREHDATLQSRIAAVEEEGRLRARAAVAAERTQAARDLHDSIGHTMSLIVVQSGMARMLETTKAVDAAERTAGALGAIERAARAALGEMDAMLNVVLDPARPAPGTAVASEDLSGLTAEVRAAGTPVHLVSDDTAGLSPALRSGIFRLVQEALTNVMKHAPGAAVTVRVRRGAGDVEISVTNTAAPGWAGELPSGSRGLMGMRERVVDLGGELSAGPDGRGGFEVHAVLPLDGPARQVHHDLGTTGGGT